MLNRYKTHHLAREISKRAGITTNEAKVRILRRIRVEAETGGECFTCPHCYFTSPSPDDIKAQYCTLCHTFPENREKEKA